MKGYIRWLWSNTLLWLLTEWRFHLLFGLGTMAFSLVYALDKNQPDVFARSGSILCLMGGFMSFRRFLRGAENEFRRDTGAADQLPFQIALPMIAKTNARNHDNSAMRWGIGFVIIGTFIWGYGDLLLIWIHVCKAGCCP
ncbi:MAG TPA: hypothetical protein VNV43_14985 [Candidatus Acidoferrales bacterium]|jgi:hypothetical protein|nr:hypothetical protein [Candidatus Acidoferrales bacterium]